MATIQSQIELYDMFSSPLMNIVNSVNMAVSTMQELNNTMNRPINTTSLDAARDAANQAGAALQELDALMDGMRNAPAAPSAPIEWDSGDITFTGTGIERFEQEVQSTNNKLNALNQTQARIAETAAQTDLFPANAVSDLNNMQNRLQAIQQRIQAIESNPMNVGSDTANAELEQLRGQLNQALQEQQALNRAVEDMDVEAANQAYLRLSQTVGNTERYIRDNVDEQGRFNSEIAQGAQEADNLMNTIKRAVAAYATIQTVKSVAGISDELVQTRSRLNMMNDGLQSTDELVNMVYSSAQDARGSFSEMADVVARFGNNAKDAFGSSAEVVAFSNLVQKQMTIAGASTQEAANAMLQLSQGLGSGVLRGDELNSIFEQAPNLIRNIADYLGVGVGEIREMASEGQLTADVVKSAIFAAADDINAKFAEMPMTWGQVWQRMQNAALMAFQPVLDRINEIANSEAFQTFVNAAINSLSTLADVALSVFDMIVSAGAFVADNWSIIAPIIYGVAAAMAVYYGWLLLTKAAEAISTAVKIAATVAAYAHAAATGAEVAATTAATAAQYGLNTALLACPITWIILLVIALVAAFYALIGVINQVAGTTISATGIIMGALATVAAFVYNVIAMIWNVFAAFIELLVNVWSNPEYAIKAFCVNVATAFINFCLACISGTGTAVGTIIGLWYVFVQAVLNVLTMVYNFFITVIEWIINAWNSGVYSIQTALVGIATAAMSVAENVASNFGSACSNIANLFINAANTAIDAINMIISALNAIPGVNIGEVGHIGTVSWDGGASAINAKKLDLQSLVGDKPAQVVLPRQSLGDLGDAYNNGKQAGEQMVAGAEQALNGAKQNLQSWLGDTPDNYWKAPTLDSFNLSDAAKAGYDFGKNLGSKVKDAADSVGSVFDMSDIENLLGGATPQTGGGSGGGGGGTGGIADDVSAIRDSLDITDEELKYLRDIAEQEVVNRYTLAELKIEQTNNNNVSSPMDLDGIVTGLTDAVNEAVDIITEGVHT